MKYFHKKPSSFKEFRELGGMALFLYKKEFPQVED